MVAITWPLQGQVLNHLQGEPTGDGLRVVVKGCVRGTATVRVNGLETAPVLGEFSTPAVLAPGHNSLLVEAGGAGGHGSHRIDVWYDCHARKRYRFSVDDNSFWLREIGTNPDEYASLFDCFYLRMWRDLHTRYGLKVVLNIYYRTADGFELPMFSDRWKGEFADHAGWLKLSWHALADKPDRPYEYVGYEQVAHDLDLVNEQIVRFAGEPTLAPPTVMHWAEATWPGVKALVDRGVRNLSGIFRKRAGRQTGNYHLRDERADLVEACAQWIDADTGLAFSQADITANNAPVETIEPFLEELTKRPEHAEILDYFTHEQYFWPFYQRYVPDHPERVEALVRWATEHGYEPCFFHEGFLGGDEIR